MLHFSLHTDTLSALLSAFVCRVEHKSDIAGAFCLMSSSALASSSSSVFVSECGRTKINGNHFGKRMQRKQSWKKNDRFVRVKRKNTTTIQTGNESGSDDDATTTR